MQGLTQNSETELKSVANVNSFSGSITIGKRSNLGFNVTVPAGGEVGPTNANEIESMIMSQDGTRVEIKK